jgi:hypothetical protein
MSWSRALIIAVGLLNVGPHAASAECVGFPLRHVADHADVVFSGTVTSLVALEPAWPYRAVVTFQADRVWKGPVTERFVIRSFSRSAEYFSFTVGRKYFVGAHQQTDAERAEFGIAAAEPPTFGVGGCGDGTIGWEHVGERGLSDLGPGLHVGVRIQ